MYEQKIFSSKRTTRICQKKEEFRHNKNNFVNKKIRQKIISKKEFSSNKKKSAKRISSKNERNSSK